MDEDFLYPLGAAEDASGRTRPASVSYDRDCSYASSNSASPRSTSSLMELNSSSSKRPSASRSLKLELESIEMGLSATISRESLLDELLGDIRRSCATSLASTPTMVSLSEGEGENVFECRLRRSEAELRTLEVSELKRIANTLETEVDTVSTLLVRLLHVKDKRISKANKQAGRLSAILKDYASKNDLSAYTDLRFSLHPPLSPSNHQQWLNAWRVLSRLPRGIPKAWRKALWSGLTLTSRVSTLDWPSIFHQSFSDYILPGDEALGMQIVKDLHRTGETGFTTEEEHAILKRVLLAYARYNSNTGYCQGFNILAALILKVVEFDEHTALKVMVNLVDYVLPENYFAQNLYALSVDMATFRELIKHILPELSQHIESLQKEASGTIKKSYSSDSPPDIHSVHAYEPPLADVFTMQWFLTMFASALPRKATRRVWDLIFLEGSEVLLYTGVAIMAVLEKDLLQTSTAADFYSSMARLGERLRKSQLISSAEFIQVIHTIQEMITAPTSNIPPIRKLREKYAYNVCPCADPDDDDLLDSQRKQNRPCPKPSRGGAFALEGEQLTTGAKKKRFKEKAGLKEAKFVSGQKTPSLPEQELRESTVKAQVKLLQDHYQVTTRQPATVRCNISLAPPQARVTCPQTRYGGVDSAFFKCMPQSVPYGPDVPQEVVEKGKALSGQDTLEALARQRKKVFTISYSQEFQGGGGGRGEGEEGGMEVGMESTHWGSFKGKSGILSNTSGPRGRLYMTQREYLSRAGNKLPS